MAVASRVRGSHASLSGQHPTAVQTTMAVAMLAAALIAATSMLRGTSRLVSPRAERVREGVRKDGGAGEPHALRAADAEAVTESVRAMGNIHKRYGKLFRPWNGTRFPLRVDDGRQFEYTPMQLFAPAARTGVNEHFRRDVAAGCLVGSSLPFVLDVSPAHFAAPHRAGMHAFNPSIVRHGDGYLVSYRVDYQGGCVVERKGMRKQYMQRAGNRHSCLVRTDAQLRVLGEARVLDACGRVVSGDGTVDYDAGTHIVDVRLARGARARAGGVPSAEPPIYVTYLPMSQFYHFVAGACKACCMACDKNTHVAMLALSRPAGRDDWAVALRSHVPLCTGAMSGRNHALFVGEDGRLRMQAWLHPRVVVGEAPRARGAPARGADADGGRVTQVASALRLGAGASVAERCAHLRISGTSSLVRVRARGRAALLGVGHLHHAREPNRSLNRMAELEQIRGGVAYFGSHYMHFFYLLDARSPYALIAHSAEWCLPHSTAAAGSCEVVQFVSGLELAHGDADVLLMYGANDCEAKSARLSLERVLGLLEWPH
ncbi:hypothetical protein KFE25_009183 [Diacronema lutheri]|uniref:Uncharacterized protein n=1 Tax=Diacronema lutheri TaxID=2081491 RepID=A0A8J5XYE0_DIALT|nr:hypothetical protein KFE25_009183 [Diacronema lutheri]